MKLYCIGDCHLGDGSNSDDFKGNNSWIISICDKVDSQKDAILVINGDFFECWQSEFHEIMDAHEEIIKRLSNMKKEQLVLIAGNHDGDFCLEFLGILLGVPVFDKWQVGDILFMHGHQFDEVNSRFKWIGKTISWIGGILEKVINKNIDIWFENLRMRICKLGRHGEEQKYIDAAYDYIKDKPDVNTIVLAHDHIFNDRYVYNDRQMYKNTGTGTKRDLLIIDTKESIEKVI